MILIKIFILTYQMCSIIEHHYLLGTGILASTSYNTLNELYNSLKTQSIFVAYHKYHDDPSSEHIHLISQTNERSKHQKIQILLNRVKNKINGLKQAAFCSLLKKTNIPLNGEKHRRDTAQRIVDNGSVNNSFNNVGKTDQAFSNLIRNMESSQSNSCLSCLNDFNRSHLVSAGFKDANSSDANLDANSDANADFPMEEEEDDEEDKDEDDDEEEAAGFSKSKKKQLTKTEKWEMIESDIIATKSENIKGIV